jgi:hypothetical protein
MCGEAVPAHKLWVVKTEEVYHMWPVEWQDSHLTRMQNRWKEIWGDLANELKDKTHEEIIEHFVQKARTGNRAYFNKYIFSKQADIDSINSSGLKNKNDPWTYSHLEGLDMLEGVHFKWTENTIVL